MIRHGKQATLFPVKWLIGVPFCLLLLMAVSPCPASGPTAASGGAAVGAAGAKEEAQLAAARSALEAQPDSAAAHIRLAYLLVDSGALEEAMRHFDAALVINPRAFQAKTGRGAVLLRTGKLQEAEQVLLGALHLNPDPVRTHYELGLLYQKLGDYGKAMTQFKEGIRKYEQGRS